MASQTSHQLLHLVLVPLMSQSHLIPFAEMAKLLASRGAKVTVVLTPLNAVRFSKFIHEPPPSSPKISFQLVPFPCKEAGLPEGCENLDTLPSPAFQPLFFAAINMLKEPLDKWLSESETLPTCIVSDICLPWTSSLATKFKIPRVVFAGISCFTLLCSHNIARYKAHESVEAMTTPFLIPGLPDRIELTKAQLPEARQLGSKAWKDAMEQFKEAELSAEGVLVNTFEELEKLYVKGYGNLAKKVWCIGPLSLNDRKQNNDKASKLESRECFDLLDSNKACSVIYACFGSLSRLKGSQLKELALGLEGSNRPFIWVIGKSDCNNMELEKWLREESFQERNRGKGVIIRGWAPQVEILSHGSVGGFLSHCGWNSTMEAVSAGVPMITWPMFAEQFYNEKLIVQVLKIGVRIGVEGAVDQTVINDDEKIGLVKREDVKMAIEEIMEESGEGRQRRSRARELAEMAHKAVQEGGSSASNCHLFIQHISGLMPTA